MIGPRASATLEAESFDLLVIGGGVLGAFLAWDASSRGLKTALIERDDFGAGTTAGSGRVLHGGLRSLQHLDAGTAIRSLRERDTISRLAPGLCAPLPFFFPADGSFRESMLMRGAALAWNGFTRSASGHVAPPARFAARRSGLPGELRDLALNGGLIVHERQIVSPERLVLAVLAAAVAAGGVVCNRVEAEQILTAGGRVAGARARDHSDDRQLEIRATRVINAAGAWAASLWPERAGPRPSIGLAKGIHLLLDRPPPPLALGLPWSEQSATGRWNRKRRVFVIPWAGITLAGASWQPVESPVEGAIEVGRREVDEFRQGLQARWPELDLSAEHVRFVTAGHYPLFGVSSVPRDRFEAARRPFVRHHSESGGPEGLITAIGVKLTTARALAERILDQMALREDLHLPACATADAPPLPGATSASIPEIGFEPIRDPELARCLARVAAEREQAGSLADVFLRRSVAGQFGLPARDVLEAAAAELARALAWTDARRRADIRSLVQFYERIGAIPPETEGSM